MVWTVALIEPPGEKGAAKAPAVNLPGAFSVCLGGRLRCFRTESEGSGSGMVELTAVSPKKRGMTLPGPIYHAHLYGMTIGGADDGGT
jgi:hypothetical protein